jgi:hypothetical protein
MLGNTENGIRHLIAPWSGTTHIRIMDRNRKILPGHNIARSAGCGVPRQRPAAGG